MKKYKHILKASWTTATTHCCNFLKAERMVNTEAFNIEQNTATTDSAYK